MALAATASLLEQRRDRAGQQLEALLSMNSAQLREEWRRVWKAPPPPLGHDLLRRGVAWKLQASAYGGVAKSVERELDRLGRQIERGGEISFERTAKAGTRLVREWHGRTHHVMVQDDGYIYEGERYTVQPVARERQKCTNFVFQS